MTTNFDPTKHRFGMAYTNGLEVIYFTHPCDDRFPDDHWMAISNGTDTVAITHCFTRSPNHDYIPRADMVELVKALEYGRCGLQRGDKGAAYLQEKALAQFKQKYGDDT